MTIEIRVLSRPDAWKWAQQRGLPGVPLDGSRLEVEMPDQHASCALVGKDGRFELVRRQGLALADGGYFVDREGNVDRVFLRHPGTLHPFEGEHSANRFMADGRHMRRLGDRQKHGQTDLTQVAGAMEIADYKRAHAHMPSQEAYGAAEVALRSVVEASFKADQNLVSNGCEIVGAVQGSTSDRALQRACGAYLERFRIQEGEETMKIVANADDEARLAECVRQADVYGAKQLWALLLGSLLLCLNSILLLLLPSKYFFIVLIGCYSVFFAGMAVITYLAGQATKRVTDLKAEVSSDFAHAQGAQP